MFALLSKPKNSLMRKLFVLLCIAYTLNVLNIRAQVIEIHPDINLTPLKDSIFIHKTFTNSENFGRFSSNGLVIVQNGEAILIDTPNDDEQTKILCNFLRDSMGVRVRELIIGHYHNDCMGGIKYIHSQGIRSIASKATLFQCKKYDLTLPMRTFSDSLILDFNGEQVVCKYFGGGHTIDNIVVWLPKEKILYGGCLVKSSRSKSLGNTADAIVNEWRQTIEEILRQHKGIEYIVPGHGETGDVNLLKHTIQLIEKYRNQKNN